MAMVTCCDEEDCGSWPGGLKRHVCSAIALDNVVGVCSAAVADGVTAGVGVVPLFSELTSFVVTAVDVVVSVVAVSSFRQHFLNSVRDGFSHSVHLGDFFGLLSNLLIRGNKHLLKIH